MWVVNSEYRPYHRKRIKVGAKDSFREGIMSTVICEVIEIVGLNINPTK